MIEKVPEEEHLYWKCSYIVHGFNLKRKPDEWFYDVALKKSKEYDNFKDNAKKIYDYKPSGLNIDFIGDHKAKVIAEFIITDKKADRSQ